MLHILHMFACVNPIIYTSYRIIFEKKKKIIELANHIKKLRLMYKTEELQSDLSV